MNFHWGWWKILFILCSAENKWTLQNEWNRFSLILRHCCFLPNETLPFWLHRAIKRTTVTQWFTKYLQCTSAKRTPFFPPFRGSLPCSGLVCLSMVPFLISVEFLITKQLLRAGNKVNCKGYGRIVGCTATLYTVGVSNAHSTATSMFSIVKETVLQKTAEIHTCLQPFRYKASIFEIFIHDDTCVMPQ